MQPMFKSDRQTNPTRDAQFMRLLNVFGQMKLGREAQLEIAQEAAGRELKLLSEMTLPEIQKALANLGIEEAHTA